ncbi:hypothetical protein FRC08_008917 [Ceratobasidium sp. 394]|nr:hypothetical protein FRC08_008917 [Ceratobasidium sp. 394]
MQPPLTLNPDSPNRGYLAVVNEYFRRQGLPAIDFKTQLRGPDHKPLWEVTPTILGEVHYCFTVSSLHAQDAKEACAEMIAKSGYC